MCVCVCVYVCVYMCMCMRMYMCVYVYVCVYVCVYVYVCVCTCACVCLCVHMHRVHMHACIQYVFMCMCICDLLLSMYCICNYCSLENFPLELFFYPSPSLLPAVITAEEVIIVDNKPFAFHNSFCLLKLKYSSVTCTNKNFAGCATCLFIINFVKFIRVIIFCGFHCLQKL